MSRALDSSTLPLRGQHLIEASAGTGKTFNIALLYLRLLLEERLGVRQIAVVTFTDAATRELRGRLRARIEEAIGRLDSGAGVEPDVLDRILEKHRADKVSMRNARDILSRALVGFDEARISTLHGLCRQLLADVAFETGLPFVELDRDTGNDAARELVRDYWRQHVVANPGEGTDAVLERWGDPDSMADKLLASQVLAVSASRIDPQDPDRWADGLCRDLHDARAEWKRLHEGGHVAAAVEHLHEVVRQGKLSVAQDSPHGPLQWLACGEESRSAEPDPAKLEPLRYSVIIEARKMPTAKAGWEPEGLLKEVATCVDKLCAAHRELNIARVARFTDNAIEFVRVGLAARRDRLRRYGFDDLISQLHAQLHGPNGDAVAERLAIEVPALLVDEFQDTDPLQYAILRRMHRARSDGVLLLIGDPKQAIYRFRGGDIFTYHSAARDAGGNRYTLRDNWRSDAGLIAATNSVFDGVADPFLVDFIGFEPAQFPEHRKPSDHWLASETPLVVWRLPDRVGKNGVIPWTVPIFGQRVLAEMCKEIRKLLSEAQEKSPASLSIAVLVKSNRQAEEAARQLAQWNIPCDYLSAASVYASAETIELERLLAALDAPGDASRVRAALATELLGEDLTALREAQRDLLAWERQLARIASLRQRWLDAGPYATIAHCVQQAAGRLLPRWDGKRRVTNLLHLAELIQHESARRSSPADLLHWLGQRRSEASEKRGEGHAEQLRPADDAGAVQVLTIHRSKGLEFDAVFAPFLMSTFWSNPGKHGEPDDAVAWHAGDELRMDIGGPDWMAHALVQREEQFAESLRLVYVAITRARHRVWLAWAYVNSGQSGTSMTGPLAWLWLRGPGITRPEELELLKSMPERVDPALQALAQRSGQRIRIEHITDESPPVIRLPDTSDASSLAPNVFSGHIERRLETLSYSRLFGGSSHALPADHDELQAQLPAPVTSPQLDPVPQWPRGAAFGVCVHEVFEKIPFSELARPGVHERLARICSDHGYDMDDQATIAAIVRSSVRSELLPGSSLTLASLSEADALAELEFLFPLGHARMDDFEAVLGDYPLHARPAGELPARRRQIAGLMTGFIDLVLRWQGRYYVLDYKTNLLGPDRSDYATAKLPAAIRAHDYDLQYLIYLVALQRFLRSRLGEAYDYDTHIGGALYLFVRGMRAGDTAGIHHDRPPAALIHALDAWCEGERA